MPGMRGLLPVLAVSGLAALTLGLAQAAAPEWNPARTHPVQIGPEARRLVVGFRATPENTVVKTIKLRARAQSVNIIQARTSDADAAGLAQRTGLAMARSRQMTPSMHVLFLQKTLYGSDVHAALKKLRADPAVQFAEVDQRRYPHSLPPDDPLFVPSAEASAVIMGTEPSTRLLPLKDAFCTMVVIWSRSAVKSAFRALRLAVSSEESAAARALPFSSFKRSEIDCPAEIATSTVETPRFKLSLTAE